MTESRFGRYSAGGARKSIFWMVQRMGIVGATISELSHVLDINHTTVSPRIQELKRGGYIRCDGRRKNMRCKNENIWVCTDEGKKVVLE